MNLRNEQPDLFEAYDTNAIAQAAQKEGMLALPNVQIELLEAHLQTFRRRYDPNFDVGHRRTAGKSVAPPRVGAAVAAFWDSVTPNTVLHGRKLKDWTVGDLRAEHKGMGNFLARFAHKRDDELVGDDWE